MEKMTHHPLRAQADKLKRALVLTGFKLHDDRVAPEVETADWAFRIFKRPEAAAPRVVFLENGTYVLRSEVLAAQLSELRGEALPIKAFSVGEVYDGSDGAHPGHTSIEGVWVGEAYSPRAHGHFWTAVARIAWGMLAETEMRTMDDGSYEVVATVDGATFVLARMGELTHIARALLALDADTPAFAFAIDVDEVAVAMNGLSSRDELYDPVVSSLKRFADSDTAYTDFFMANTVNTLRKRGFCEFRGMRAYPEDCYKKMNMIQEAWDLNNRGMQIDEPMGDLTGLPTVLTPSLEEALAANWRAGEESCLIFEVGHIFLPNVGGTPIEKRAISFGGYGPDLDKVAWRKLVDELLTGFGVINHFFIPIPYGMAPAYDFTDSFLVMDQHMNYCECNFGTISATALENHGIGTQAFMAQFEFEPLERKALEDFNFVPNDYQ